MTRVLSIIHAKGLAQFNYKSEVVALESYLVVSNTSTRTFPNLLPLTGTIFLEQRHVTHPSEQRSGIQIQSSGIRTVREHADVLGQISNEHKNQHNERPVPGTPEKMSSLSIGQHGLFGTVTRTYDT